MGGLYLMGAVIYAARVPERWRPGMFCYAFHSHNIFHFLVRAALRHTAQHCAALRLCYQARVQHHPALWVTSARRTYRNHTQDHTHTHATLRRSSGGVYCTLHSRAPHECDAPYPTWRLAVVAGGGRGVRALQGMPRASLLARCAEL